MSIDFTNVVLERNGSVSATVPRFNVVFDVIDPKTGVITNSINTTFPALLNQFTNAELEQPFRDFLEALAKLKFGG